MSKTFTAADLIAEVRKVAEANPDHVYRKLDSSPSTAPTCVYVERDENYDRQPGCVIGHALLNLGVGIGWLEFRQEREDSGVLPILEDLADFGMYRPTVADPTLRGRQDDWLRQVQHLQDGGKSWRYAIETASEDVCLLPEVSE